MNNTQLDNVVDKAAAIQKIRKEIKEIEGHLQGNECPDAAGFDAFYKFCGFGFSPLTYLTHEDRSFVRRIIATVVQQRLQYLKDGLANLTVEDIVPDE